MMGIVLLGIGALVFVAMVVCMYRDDGTPLDSREWEHVWAVQDEDTQEYEIQEA